MRKLILLLALLALLQQGVFSDFRLDRIEMTIKDIKSDGSARVTESIRFVIDGDYASSLYENGFNKNDLSFWASTTNLKDVRLHIDPNKVDIKDFRLTPQPRKCNPFLEVCRGELVIEYVAYPYFSNQTNEHIEGTGIFRTVNEKPRTTKYYINPDALLFRRSEQGDTILDKNTFLRINFPESGTILDANPLPEGTETKTLPAKLQSLVWTNTALVRFSLAFDVEESLDREVSGFFSDLLYRLQKAVTGEHGVAVLAIMAIFTGTYIYLQAIKRR